MHILKDMSASALTKVEDFRVFNQFGSVQWIGETDVTGLDLADLITIQQS